MHTKVYLFALYYNMPHLNPFLIIQPLSWRATASPNGSLYRIDCADFFTISSVTSTRGHMYKLQKPHSTSRVRCIFFLTRVIKCWNESPEDLVTASSLNEFKNNLDGFLSEHFFYYY